MPPKHINPNRERGYIGESDKKYRSPPKPYIEAEWLEPYKAERNIILALKYPDDAELQERVKTYPDEKVIEVISKYNLGQRRLL